VGPRASLDSVVKRIIPSPCRESSKVGVIFERYGPYPMDTGTLFVWVKWSSREADHSYPSSADVKDARSFSSIPQYVFIALCLVRHRDYFTFSMDQN
jgi:hypothetical protein